MALHAQTRKLARHGRIRTRRSDEPMPEPTHSRQADPGKRSRCLGAPSKQASRQGRLAIHNRKRPGQAQEALSPIRMTRATSFLNMFLFLRFRDASRVYHDPATAKQRFPDAGSPLAIPNSLTSDAAVAFRPFADNSSSNERR